MVLILPTPKPLYSKLPGINLWGFKLFFCGTGREKGRNQLCIVLSECKKRRSKKKKTIKAFVTHEDV